MLELPAPARPHARSVNLESHFWAHVLFCYITQELWKDHRFSVGLSCGEGLSWEEGGRGGGPLE